MAHVMFRYEPSQISEAVHAALRAIAEDFPIQPCSDRQSPNVIVRLEGEGCRIDYDNGGPVVHGGTIPQILRALAALRAGQLQRRPLSRQWRQTPAFDTIGLMLDASRNAVPTVATVKLILRRMALMGMNTLLLYMEDTYEVPGQPQIGYLRGRYSQAELRVIDQFAAVLGIEIVPCIQALAHLGQMLRWPAFDAVRDTSDILLVDEPRTYALLEQMIDAASSPFRSKRIHIGMDEAHDLGMGRYRQRHGVRPGFEIITSHLRRVMAVTRRMQLQPMIWSDMYFRLGSTHGDYHDPNWRIPRSIVKQIPRDLQLVYWDYYHADPAEYVRMIRRHRTLGSEPVFAGGLWTWSVFWQNISKVRVNTDAAMQACKAEGVREVFTTAWGDDGAEVHPLSMLPGLQHFAEHAYRSTVNDAAVRSAFLGSTGADVDAWTTAAAIDVVPGLASMKDVGLHTGQPSERRVAQVERSSHVNLAMANPSKYLLWQDPLLGLFDTHVQGLPLARHYAALEKQLGRPSRSEPSLVLPRLLAAVLKHKAELGWRLASAYRRGNRAALRRLADQTMPRLLRDLSRLHAHHRTLWHQFHKPHGWEVLDARYATLHARVTTARLRIKDYLAGRIKQIEELDEPRQPIMAWPPHKLGLVDWPARRMISPSIIA